MLINKSLVLNYIIDNKRVKCSDVLSLISNKVK